MKKNHIILSILIVFIGIILFLLVDLGSMPQALAVVPSVAGEPGGVGLPIAGGNLYPSTSIGAARFAGGRSVLSTSQASRCGAALRETASMTDPKYFTRLFSVNADSSSGAGGVFPAADGYFVFNQHASANGFVKFNLSGFPVLAQDYAGSASYVNRYAVNTGDGKYLLGGVRYSSPVSGYLAKGNADTSVMWAKSISSTSYPNWIAGIASTADNGVLALARDWGFGILKFDSSGTLLFKKRINLASPSVFADIFSIYENYYLDASLNKHCGGYILFGNVYFTMVNPDIYLAAVSCDGTVIYWQKIIRGASWDGSVAAGVNLYPLASNIVVVADNNGVNTQNATLAVAATTDSFGDGTAIMLVPFTITGNTIISNTVTFSQIKLLDGDQDEFLEGPYAGMNFMRLSDGNLLLTGETNSSGAGDLDLFLVKMNPSFQPIWQYTYGTLNFEAGGGLAETVDGLQVVGVGSSSIFMNLAADGTGQDLCLERQVAAFTVSNISPTIDTPTYVTDNGAMTIGDEAISQSSATPTLDCPQMVYAPVMLK